ncbi:MAG: hypothetical protein OXK82_12085 [Deltaproteobacteria bacterium]|nr:hypothetical protein [Deltaproteobacteria bacterium]
MLYKLNIENPERSEKVAIRPPVHFSIREEHIENFVKSRLSEIVSEEHLMLIGQERKGQEEADLLAIDKAGTLFIFELKRWESNTENLLQVMRYGQIFGRYPYQDLQDLARRQQKLEGSLQDAHKKHFDLNEAIDKSKFNRKQHFVLVTDGVDADTISAVEYWSGMGVQISCSPYRLYEINGIPYIQFDTFNPAGDIVVETNTQHFIVNTNRTWMEHAWNDMLGNREQGKASAYYDRKWSICNIPANSIIYLYHTGVGVIAKGNATEGFKKANYENDIDEEFYVPLDFEWAVDQDDWDGRAIAAWEINSRLNSGHRFRQTVFTASKEMAGAIDELAEEKGNVTSVPRN